MYDIPYMQNLKRNGTSELMYVTGTDSQTYRANYGCLGRWMEERIVRDLENRHICTATFKMNNQKCFTV